MRKAAGKIFDKPVFETPPGMASTVTGKLTDLMNSLKANPKQWAKLAEWPKQKASLANTNAVKMRKLFSTHDVTVRRIPDAETVGLWAMFKGTTTRRAPVAARRGRKKTKDNAQV